MTPQKTKIILFCLMFLFSGFLNAQSFLLKVSISDGELPIPYAQIFIKENKSLNLCDSNGKYSLLLPKGTYTMVCMRVGYKEKNIKIKLADHATIYVALSPNVFDLKSVSVTPKNDGNLAQITKLDLQLRPLSSSQDVLRAVPGLFIAQHAGGGKAEQIFMRGFDVDHGTDFAIYVDGIPVNMPSHAHGQGYADLHFLIPETVGQLEVNKGPHSTKYGDLATAGSGEFKTLNVLDHSLLKLEYGSFQTRRALLMVNLLNKRHLFTENRENLYMAFEYKFSNAYFEQKQFLNRWNGFIKYTGVFKNDNKIGFSASTFTSRWDASGQIPRRAVEGGSISRYGSIDPSEGGQTSRTNINFTHEKKFGKAVLKNQLYYSKYDFNLFSNFTFYLNDSLKGDQIEQKDNRHLMGVNSNLSMERKIFSKVLKTQIGIGSRFDASLIALNHSEKRKFISSTVAGNLRQLNSFMYIDETLVFSKRLQVNLGTRSDFYVFNFQNNTYDTASGITYKNITSPKINLTYALHKGLTLYVKSGYGFHSNDARAVIVGHLENTLARAFGNEISLLNQLTKKTWLNLALWTMDLQSELIYVGDEGIVEIAGRTRRVGLDVGIRQQWSDHIYFDADINVNKGKLRDAPITANRIPLAPGLTSTGGFSYKKSSGLNGSIRYRYMADRPATEDYALIAKGYLLVDFVANYLFKNYQIGLNVENILNAPWMEAQFATESRLKSEIASTTEIHFTPGTPFFARLSFNYNF